uniref:Uncharacterized protein n=1 Tax=Anguilla anguilla TaxID=7936 RepID=A0A0E9PWZ4_ANGAN
MTQCSDYFMSDASLMTVGMHLLYVALDTSVCQINVM